MTKISLCLVALLACFDSAFADDLVSAFSLKKEVCDFVANHDEYANNIASYKKLLGSHVERSQIESLSQVQGYIDVNNDKKDELVFLTSGGTAHVTNYEIFDVSSGKKIELNIDINSDEYEDWRWAGWGSGDFRWLRYKGYTFLIAGQEPKLPRHLWFIDQKNNLHKMCSFKQSNEYKYSSGKVVNLKNLEKTYDLCRKLGSNEISSYKQIKKDDKGAFYLGNETDASGEYYDADIDNDGKPQKVYLGQYSSGRGAGCDKKFLFIDVDKNLVVDWDYSKKQSQINDDFYKEQDGVCNAGNSTRIFNYNGYDIVEIDNPENADRKRKVLLFKDKKTFSLCEFTYGIKLIPE